MLTNILVAVSFQIVKDVNVKLKQFLQITGLLKRLFKLAEIQNITRLHIQNTLGA